MEQGEQKAVLYDFLYKDSSRIASYYAQIFGGRLSSLEESDSKRKVSDKQATLDISVASGELKYQKEVQSVIKRVSDPHDLITTDILAFLSENNYLHKELIDAHHGSLIIAQGALILVDRHILELATVGLDIAAKEEGGKDRARQLREAKYIKELLPKLSLPSVFLIQTTIGIQISGTIKDGGMEEPISSYYFKHGAAGLADVYVIGIKEITSTLFTLPNLQLIGVGQHAAQALSDMLFPKEAIRVTPIALFRKL